MFNHYIKLIIFIISGFIISLIIKENAIGIYNSTFFLSAISSAIFILVGIRKKGFNIPVSFSLLYLLFLSWQIISLSTSQNTGISIWEIIKIFSFFILFIGIYNLVENSKQNLNFLLKSLTITGLIVFIYSFLIYFIKGNFILGEYFVGTFYWHNQMAGFLLFLIPLSIGILLSVKKRVLKYLLSILIITLSVGMFLTYSRGGWISILASLPVLFIFSSKIILQNKKIFALIGLITIFIFAFISYKPYSHTTSNVKNLIKDITPQEKTVSGNLRLTVWKNGLLMTLENPIYGVGPGAFGASYYAFQQDPWLYARNAHNYFVEIAAETGFPGLIFFILIISYTFYLIFKNKNKIIKTKDPLLFAIITALFASLLHAFVDFDWARISLYAMFWILIAMLLSNFKIKEIKIRLSGKNYFIYLIPVSVFALSIIFFRAESFYKQAADYYEIKLNMKLSEKSLNEAIKLNPYDSRYYMYLGGLKRMSENDKDAKLNFNKALKVYPLYSEPYYQLGQIEQKNKNYKTAEKMLLKAIEYGTYSTPGYYSLLADLYMKQNKLDLAEETLEKAVYKSFPLNESYKGFEYMYTTSGFKKGLANLYFRLIDVKIILNKKEEAKKLISVIENEFDSSHPALSNYKKQLKE